MFLTFGEVMLRLAPEGVLRLDQVLPGRLEASFGGGEANVAVSLALLGAKARYMTALPDNPVADAAVCQMRGLGVDMNHVVRTKGGRMGVYFLETGANQRGSVVVYDRAGSSVCSAGPEIYDMKAALEGVDWVHVTGITPAIGEKAFESALALVKLASKRGATVSCDLNFRKKLWKWRKGVEPRALARECMGQILEYVDVVIGNEEDASDVLGISEEGSELDKGVLNVSGYAGVARKVAELFPNVKKVAITLRQSISATHNNWGAMLYDSAKGKACFAPVDADGVYCPYEIKDIVDRVGGGDSFCAGLIFALGMHKYGSDEECLAFAAAASCLKHSVAGDFNFVRESEVVSLMKGNASGRVKR